MNKEKKSATASIIFGKEQTRLSETEVNLLKKFMEKEGINKYEHSEDEFKIKILKPKKPKLGEDGGIVFTKLVAGGFIAYTLLWAIGGFNKFVLPNIDSLPAFVVVSILVGAVGLVFVCVGVWELACAVCKYNFLKEKEVSFSKKKEKIEYKEQIGYRDTRVVKNE